jgi:hypothetical protein
LINTVRMQPVSHVLTKSRVEKESPVLVTVVTKIQNLD